MATCRGSIWRPRPHLATGTGPQDQPSSGHRLFLGRGAIVCLVPPSRNEPKFCYSHCQDSASAPLARLSSEKYSWLIETPRRRGSGGPRAAPCDANSRSAPPPPGPTPLPGRWNWSLWGVPRAESACLFKRPRGAPCEPPRAGGGGHGRGRLAPGGRGSTTKLRPLSLRIGRALQTGGGRALGGPSLSPVLLGPGVGRARASRPPVRCTRVCSALPQ